MTEPPDVDRAAAREAELLSGNEAIGRGAWQAGVRFASAYPGTPSTEVLETLARLPGVTAQWSVNEKVALESAVGASLGGARALCSMKHVGLNVASDPLMTLGLTGVNGGLVIVSADDPGMMSSQNEQDNRRYASFAGIPCLEPSDPAECQTLARRAFDLSERYDLPVMLRTTTPINHGKGLVAPRPRMEVALREVVRDAAKWVMLPAYGRRRRLEQLERLDELANGSHELELHRIDQGHGPIAIVTAGVSYGYVKEAAPEAAVLKLALVHPLPLAALRAFALEHPALLVVEELDGFIEESMRAAGIGAFGKQLVPRTGALDVASVRAAHARACAAARSLAPRVTVAVATHEKRNGSSSPAISAAAASAPEPALEPTPSSCAASLDVPGRPPVLCPACPYRGVMRAFRRQERFVFGDIGCYTLGALMPHEAIHFTLCMGASIAAAAGFARARPGTKALAVIGDSTFLHSGMTALLDVVYNRASITLVILDNCAIAMTGGQGHPGTGASADGEVGAGVDYEALIRALGVRRVTTVDPYDGQLFARTLDRDMATPEPTVIVARRSCVLVDRDRVNRSAFVNPAMCTGCRACLDEGCPALVLYRNHADEDRVRIDRELCVGCPDCSQVCDPGAISWFPTEAGGTPAGGWSP